jgi:acyl-CoA hydrolase
MHWIDLVAAIAAARHAQRVCVTASVDDLNFLHPIKIGEVVTLMASVNRVFRTSMEVGVKVLSENLLTGTVKHANTAYLTFVALDQNGTPMSVPQVTLVPAKRNFADLMMRCTDANYVCPAEKNYSLKTIIVDAPTGNLLARFRTIPAVVSFLLLTVPQASPFRTDTADQFSEHRSVLR